MNRFGVAIALGMLSITGCGANAEGDNAEIGESAAALSEEVTTSSQVTYVCSPSQAFRIAFEVTHPATVSPGEAFPVTVHAVNLIPPTVAPVNGSWTSTQELLATAATPGTQGVPLGTFQFTTGQILSDLGSGSATLTAAAGGGPVVLDAGAYDYTVTFEPSGGFTNHCEPAEGEPSLATIPLINVPTTKDDCKNGGWQTHTDAENNAFTNQGRCIAFVNH